MLKGDPEAIENAIAQEQELLLEGQYGTLVTGNSPDSIGVIEAVVASGPLVLRRIKTFVPKHSSWRSLWEQGAISSLRSATSATHLPWTRGLLL